MAPDTLFPIRMTMASVMVLRSTRSDDEETTPRAVKLCPSQLCGWLLSSARILTFVTQAPSPDMCFDKTCAFG